MAQSQFIPYMAGLFDGEAHIGAFTLSKKSGGNKDVRVLIGMRYEAGVLSAAQKMWGGSIRIRKDGITMWHITGRNLDKFLSDIEPFVVVKQKQLLLAQDFRATKKIYSHPLSDAIIKFRNIVDEKMRDLNHFRGGLCSILM